MKTKTNDFDFLSKEHFLLFSFFSIDGLGLNPTSSRCVKRRKQAQDKNCSEKKGKRRGEEKNKSKKEIEHQKKKNERNKIIKKRERHNKQKGKEIQKMIFVFCFTSFLENGVGESVPLRLQKHRQQPRYLQSCP